MASKTRRASKAHSKSQSRAHQDARSRPQAAAPARPAPAPRATQRQRRLTASVEAAVVVGVFLFLVGGVWDVAWHIDFGRESFLSPPHLVLYGGITIVLAASASALLAAARRRRLPTPGAIIAALGAVMALSSAPFDDLWHRLYGLDITIWSPPHLLLIGGMAITAYGALAGFALRANRQDPERLARLWRSTGVRGRARGNEIGLFLAAGLALMLSTSVVAEYAFDVSRYPVIIHPILLSAMVALVLTAAARASGRVGSATLAAAVFTALGLLLNGMLLALNHTRFQLALLLLAAPALDLALWRWTPRWGWRAVPLAGALLALALLLVQWPYTVAAGRTVWDGGVILRALAPSLLAGAVGAWLGWTIGAPLRPVDAQPPLPAGRRRRAAAVGAAVAAPVRWDGWDRAPGWLVLLAGGGLFLGAIAPAALNAGASPVLPPARFNAPGVVGSLEFTPAVPVAGQPLTLTVTFNDPGLLGRAPAVPFETARLGEITQGAMLSTGEPGVFETQIVPHQPGRRWVRLTYPSDTGPVAASAALVVYRPGEALAAPTRSPRFLTLRPEQEPEGDLPAWLEPGAYAALLSIVTVVLAGIAWVLARTARTARVSGASPTAGAVESSGALAR